ncbi:MBL fold metallo-hydrolase, partial [bacterium]|nr:MBL fold metallo-hydrolase [bacterium]
MFVKIWGARGSIPVCGQEYIKYGGDTTCIEIRSKNGRVIIIDAGTGIRRLGKDLLAQGLYEYDLI